MHTISEDKLNMLVSGNNSVNLTFFGVCFGAAVSFGTVVKTTALEPFNKALFTMLFASMGLIALFFGIQSYRSYRSSKSELDAIKKTKISN